MYKLCRNCGNAVGAGKKHCAVCGKAMPKLEQEGICHNYKPFIKRKIDLWENCTYFKRGKCSYRS